MSGPRLDINAWEIGGERLAGEIADVGRIEPFEEFIAGDWMVKRPEFVEWLEGPPNRDDHRGLKWPLNRGVLYDTDVAEVGAPSGSGRRDVLCPERQSGDGRSGI